MNSDEPTAIMGVSSLSPFSSSLRAKKLPESKPKTNQDLAMEAFRFWVGDPKTRLSRNMIAFGITFIASPWWQPYINGLAVKWFNLDPTRLGGLAAEMFYSGWILILLGTILYIRATLNAPAVAPTTSNDADTVLLDSSVSEPIQRNAFMAFDQLCTAAFDLPTSFINGVVQEKQMRTQVRVRQIESAQQQQPILIDDVSAEYVKATGRKFVERMVREQINLDAIVFAAVKEINDQARLEASSGEKAKETDVQQIDPDWLNQFETEVRHVSSDAMRILFGRILAGEIQRPNSFSMRAIKILRELDVNTANLFRTLCSCTVTVGIGNQIIYGQVPSVGLVPGSNGLTKFGLSFSNLHKLNERGLIISDFNSRVDYKLCVIINNSIQTYFKYQRSNWGLLPINGNAPADGAKVYEKEIKVHGILLTEVGTELLPIVDVDSNPEFTAALEEFWKTQNFMMTPVKLPHGNP